MAQDGDIQKSSTDHADEVIIFCNSKKKFSKQRLGDMYFDLNKLKAMTYVARAEFSKNKHEQRWLSYVKEQC